MAAPLTADQKAAIRCLVDQGITSGREIGRRLGIGHVAAGRHAERYLLKKGDGPAPQSPQPPSEPAKLAAPTVDEMAERIARTRDLRREKDELLAIAGEKSFRAYLESILRDVAPRFEPMPRGPAVHCDRDTSRESMLLVWSDWHAFEEVKAARTMGFNEFTGDILCERVRRIVLSTLSIKQRLERGGGWAFPECHVALNGDFISGTIHELERHSDAANVVHAAFATGCLIAAAIRDLTPHFDRIVCHCTSGNHGRLPDARKKQMKDPTRNWDTVIYLYAMQALAAAGNVKWDIPDSYFSLYDIDGWRFLQAHGDDIKSWNSIPFYGIERSNRNTNALFSSRREKVDYFVISHFHSISSTAAPGGGESFLNGSLIGGTEFSIGALGKSDRPAQWMFTVNEEHGVASRWPIFGVGRKPVEPYPLPAWPVAG